MVAVRRIAKLLFIPLVLVLVILLQYEYDLLALKPAAGSSNPSFSPEITRLTDLGFHATIASFSWASTMPEVLKLFFTGDRSYLTDVTRVNGIDPKLGFPYAFSVLILPVIPTSSYPYALRDSFAIREAGIANADPDWRIPYYMAINYYLVNKDLASALKYFDIAAHTPGIPDYALRFSLNFGIARKERDRVRELWMTVYQSSNDPSTKDRAAGYVERLNDFDYLEAAMKAYKQKFGVYPSSTDELVAKKIIPSAPLDPFGFTFTLNAKEGTAGIDTLKPPPGATPLL